MIIWSTKNECWRELAFHASLCPRIPFFLREWGPGVSDCAKGIYSSYDVVKNYILGEFLGCWKHIV